MGLVIEAVVSKMLCSAGQVVLGVRSRPHVVAGGGGFVVTDLSTGAVVFRVDGCGVLGKKDHISLTHAAYQTPLLLIRRRKGGIVEAVSCLHKEWGGYTTPAAGAPKLVFTLKDPKEDCFGNNRRRPMRVVSTQQNIYFEVKGYFPDKECSIVDSGGKVIAQVGVSKEVAEKGGDLYHVVVKPGIDQAFVIGVIAILDYIHNGSTTC